MLEAAAQHGKAVWVLDRPNPAGRPVEGTRLRAGWESFVGAGPMMMRHGLTMGELGRSEEHKSELQSLMRISYAVLCLNKKQHTTASKATYTEEYQRLPSILNSMTC